MNDVWAKADDYFEKALISSDPALDASLAANRKAGLPPIDVSPLQGKFLDLLVRISGARRVLEIGTLGGYSSLWFARAVGPDGKVVTLEANSAHAAVAQSNFARAGLSERIELRVGRALDTLPSLAPEPPFDLIFIDADKESSADYLAWALRLSKAGTIVVVDNVVRGGKVVDAKSKDASVRGIRALAAMIAAEPRLSATAIQTVGVKGHDGFLLAVVLS